MSTIMFIYVLSFVVSLHLLKPVDMESRIRNKRVLFGLPGYRNDRDRYQSFRYYVFLAKGATLDKVSDRDWLAYWLGLTAPIPNELLCGGVLLTPSVVQTACHCISHFFFTEDGGNLSRAWSKNVWEDRIYSYFGANLATEMWDMLRPKHYVTYAKCKKLEGVAMYTMFDYGLIISGDTIADKNPNAKISYAPVYIATDLLKFYYQALQNEYMCLLIGHGPHETDYDEEDNLVEDTEPSNEIRWGWRTVMNYLDCLTVSYNIRDRQTFYYNYTRDATWVCAHSFDPVSWSDYYVNTQGDSGGPMTCNDVYFSIFSMTTPVKFTDIISYSGPIVNTHFENAVEYRPSLHQFVQDFDGERPKAHPEDPRVTPTPPFQFPIDAARSHGPTRITNSPLIILCTTLFSAL